MLRWVKKSTSIFVAVFFVSAIGATPEKSDTGKEDVISSIEHVVSNTMINNQLGMFEYNMLDNLNIDESIDIFSPVLLEDESTGILNNGDNKQKKDNVNDNTSTLLSTNAQADTSVLSSNNGQADAGNKADASGQGKGGNIVDANGQGKKGNITDANGQTNEGNITDANGQTNDGDITDVNGQTNEGNITDVNDQTNDGDITDVNGQTNEGNITDANEQTSEGNITDVNEQANVDDISNANGQGNIDNMSNADGQTDADNISHTNDQTNTGDISDAEDQEDALNEESIPEILKQGIQHPVIAQLQTRLMELGFMEYAEPTEYFGTITESAVNLFKRQNELEQDGILDAQLFELLLSEEAKHYLVKKGVSGDDVLRIQTRLYETGYITSTNNITGYFGDVTEAAVMKLQEANGLMVDGKVGQQTIELLYSEEIKSNFLSFGEKSDKILSYQKRLKELGYLTTTPDGIFGADTVIAVKQFQSRNDLIVDGYLGPTTCNVLDSANAVPNGLFLGDSGDSVKRLQELLSKYGYISSSNTTGYFGSITEEAVKAFQSNNGLHADGMVGIKTMTKLTSGNVNSASYKSSGSSSSSSSSSGSSNSSGNSSSNSNNSSSNSSSQKSGSIDALISVAKSKVGSPYVYGSKGPNSFDCSGFVYWCLNQVGVKQSFITSSGWINVKKYVKVSKFSDIKPGDIIVVKGHVGIAAYNGTVIDASSSRGKIVHRELGAWWRDRFIVAWRIF